MAARFTLDNLRRGLLTLNELGYVSPYFTLDNKSLGTLDDGRLTDVGVGFVVGDSSWLSDQIAIPGLVGPTQTTNDAPVFGVVGYTGSISESQQSAGLAIGVAGYSGNVVAISIAVGFAGGSPQITDAISGESSAVGAVVGVVSKSGNAISVSVSDGVAIGSVTFFGFANGTNATAHTLFALPNLDGFVSSNVASNGIVVGVEGNTGNVSNANASSGNVVGSVGYAGTISIAINSTGFVLGVVTYQGTVIGVGNSTGTVTGEIQVINLFGNVEGFSISSGNANGFPNLAGSIAATSISVGRVRDILPQPNPEDSPATMPWFLSGARSFKINTVNGVTESFGTARGVFGLVGVVRATNKTIGITSGRVRIREQDDLEVLELLGMI